MVTIDASELMAVFDDIETKISNITKDYPHTAYKIMAELERGIREEEYIPYRDPHVKTPGNPHHLQDNVKIGDDYIWWKNNYANDKYYDSSVSRQFHINASPEWDKAYLADYGDKFEDFVLDTIMEDLFNE